ncbi:MAG: cupin domain-containing protein [Cytophagales bacterium]|nr:cupin domain-containing protein [Bernardetiaceae bacterium]MDW8204935.1 cupin domain-containing protein [Cytophagales bacterium]
MSVQHLSQIPAKEYMPGFWGRMIHTKHATLAYWEIAGDSVLPLHSHPHEQTVNMLEGEFEITVEGHTRVLRAGDILIIPSNAPHQGRATGKPCKILDVFCPVREDYLT